MVKSELKLPSQLEFDEEIERSKKTSKMIENSVMFVSVKTPINWCNSRKEIVNELNCFSEYIDLLVDDVKHDYDLFVNHNDSVGLGSKSSRNERIKEFFKTYKELKKYNSMFGKYSSVEFVMIFIDSFIDRQIRLYSQKSLSRFGL